jgi:glycolate oxidase
MGSGIYDKIKGIVGEENVSESEYEKLFYSRDVSPISPKLQKKLGTSPDIIARPRNTEDVAEIVKLANENKVPIIPRGGASWWLGGCVPYKGGIVLDLTSINQVIELDEKNLTVTSDCGVTWGDLEAFLERRSFFLGTRPGSAASATVGGWISTGGVGFGSYRYGSVGDLVRSLEVVLPNGQIIETGNGELAGQGSGYNLNRLFVGGEGTLGIITKATLRILPKPDGDPVHVSYIFADVNNYQEAINDLVRSSLPLHHIAFGDKGHFEFLGSAGAAVPQGEIVLCITLETIEGATDQAKERLDEKMRSAGGSLGCKDHPTDDCRDGTIEFRGWISNVYPVPGEIFVGVDRFTEIIGKIYELTDEMNLEAGIIGSVVDRGTVMFMPYFLHKQDEDEPFMEFHRRLGDIALKLGGRRVGLGLYFSSSVTEIRSKGSVELMRLIKANLDPGNIMNPGKTVCEKDVFETDNGTS